MGAARFSSDSLPVGERLSGWADRLRRLGLSAVATGGSPGGGIAVAEASSGAILAEIVADPQSLVGAAGTADAAMLFLQVVKGRARLVAGRKIIEIAEGDFAVIDRRFAFELSCHGDVHLVMLLVPRAALAARLGRTQLGLPVVLARTVAAGAARSVLRTLATGLDSLDPADFGAAETALTELVASALLGEASAPDGDLTGVQAAHFRRVSSAIEAQLSNPDLGLADIARQEGMSVRYLQRLFERRDENFSDHLRRRRLERTRADLLDPNHQRDSVAAIGLRWGFRDQAYFSRAFSAEFAMTPTAMRRSATTAETGYALRGKPTGATGRNAPAPPSLAPGERPRHAAADRHHLPATAHTVHWGYLSRSLPPVLRVAPGATVTVETLTQHAGDDWERMVAGDPGAESVFQWTSSGKNVDRRGAGPMNASVFGRGAGEGFGVHICTGPIAVEGAEPGDVLEVEILDIRPRPSANPRFAGRAFASNASAWWGYQYGDLLGSDKRETVTIFEIDTGRPDVATPLYSYVWTPQADPFGTVHRLMDYPGVPVDHDTVIRRDGVLAGIAIPARMHFGFMAVAPRESELIDSIPPGYFGGNVDNWRAGKGAKVYLPVAVEGALLSLGDGHFVQADGEVNGTGLECSLTGDLRITLHKAGATAPAAIVGLRGPLIETPTHWVIQSFSYPNYLRDLGKNAQAEVYQKSTVDLALRNAFRQARRFLMDVYGLSEDESLTLMSLAADFGVTQVADGNFGVHATIAKSIFAGRQR